MLTIVKLQIGDKVKIINYGHIIWGHDEIETIYTNDKMPSLVGQEGKIIGYDIHTRTYTLEGIKGKCSPFNRDQLEKI